MWSCEYSPLTNRVGCSCPAGTISIVKPDSTVRLRLLLCCISVNQLFSPSVQSTSVRLRQSVYVSTSTSVCLRIHNLRQPLSGSVYASPSIRQFVSVSVSVCVSVVSTDGRHRTAPFSARQPLLDRSWPGQRPRRPSQQQRRAGRRGRSRRRRPVVVRTDRADRADRSRPAGSLAGGSPWARLRPRSARRADLGRSIGRAPHA